MVTPNHTNPVSLDVPYTTPEVEAKRLIRRHPGWYAVIGGLLAALGILAMMVAMLTTLASVLVFGALLLVGGLLQIVDIFVQPHRHGFLNRVISGILSLLLGMLLLVAPVEGAIGLTLVLAIYFLAVGITRFFLASQVAAGWRLSFILGGAINILLGLVIWLGWPISGLFVIGLFVGIDLLMSGLITLILALQSNRAAVPA